MYISIEKAQELAEASLTMKSGADSRIKFLQKALEQLNKIRNEDVHDLLQTDLAEVESEFFQGRLPKWWINLATFRKPNREYWSNDAFGIYIGHIASNRQEWHRDQSAVTPIIEEAREELNRLAHRIYGQDVVDEVEGFRARVDDATAINRTNFSLTRDLYLILTRHAA